MQTEIEQLFEKKAGTFTEQDFELFSRFKAALNSGAIRSAEPDPSARSGWRVNMWVKQGILAGFRMGAVVNMSPDPVRLPMLDKATYPVKRLGPNDGVRLVPGGSSIRDGCYIGKGVVCMPPMYINAGTWIGDGTIIDSHALVGSCAQVGNHCHVSAAAQIGGVLEPVGLLPVIVEDEAVIGGNCGVYEGTVVKRRAVLGSGTILTRSTPVYDIVRGEVYRATDDEPLVIPDEAVVVPGSRAVTHGVGKEWGISLYTPVIVKYRDSKTDARVQLEDFLR
jgi:2,3,4,5-tetrahydropyridine-2,6-dicarboxylate N-succinyltransferase